MTRKSNARIAGYALLLYIAAGIPSMILFNGATGGEGIAAMLAGIAERASDVRIAAVLTFFCGFAALALGVSMWSLTRDQDPDLAMMGLACRVAEGVVGGMAVKTSMGLLWLATADGVNAPTPEGAEAVGAYLLMGQGGPIIAGTFFAVGSTLFSWLFLRGRMIPVPLAWLGVISSVLLVVALPLQLAGVVSGTVIQFLWAPMAAFEIPLALWLIIKGAAMPSPRQST